MVKAGIISAEEQRMLQALVDHHEVQFGQVIIKVQDGVPVKREVSYHALRRKSPEGES